MGEGLVVVLVLEWAVTSKAKKGSGECCVCLGL